MSFTATGDSNRAQMRYAVETVVGTTPTGPLTNLRMTGESVNSARSTTTSAEIRSDAQISDLITTGESASGTINFEPSAGEYDPFLAAMLRGTWSSGVLVNGTARQSFTFEKGFEDTGKYYQFVGAEVVKGSFDFKTGATMTGSMDIMARHASNSTTTVGTGTPVASQTGSVFNTVTDFQGLTINSVAATGVQELKLDINLNGREQKQIGTKDLAGVGMGFLQVTGSGTMYLQSGISAIESAYYADTAIPMTWTIAKGGKSYTFLLPAIKVSSLTVNATGVNQDVVISFNFQAILDPVSGHTIQITKV
jgi:hypothetical protein